MAKTRATLERELRQLKARASARRNPAPASAPSFDVVWARLRRTVRVAGMSREATFRAYGEALRNEADKVIRQSYKIQNYDESQRVYRFGETLQRKAEDFEQAAAEARHPPARRR